MVIHSVWGDDEDPIMNMMSIDVELGLLMEKAENMGIEDETLEPLAEKATGLYTMSLSLRPVYKGNKETDSYEKDRASLIRFLPYIPCGIFLLLKNVGAMTRNGLI